MTTRSDATGLVEEAEGGNRLAADELLTIVYDELHELAGGKMRGEAKDHTLQPTALVHEAFLRLVDQTRVGWKGKTHFKAVAAMAMHRVLVDHARGKNCTKRGGGRRPVTLYDAFALVKDHTLDALALHDALEKMRRVDERQTQVVEYRLFGGLSSEETARLLGISTRTVERDWTMAQAWLRGLDAVECVGLGTGFDHHFHLIPALRPISRRRHPDVARLAVRTQAGQAWALSVRI